MEAGRYVDGTADQWQVVAETVTARRHALGLTRTQAVDKSGGAVSLSVWANLETAKQDRYLRTKLLAVCNVLGWTPNSIDQLLAGGQADATTDPADAAVVRVWQTETALVELMQRDRAMQADLQDLRAQIADLRALLTAVLERPTDR